MTQQHLFVRSIQTTWRGASIGRKKIEKKSEKGKEEHTSGALQALRRGRKIFLTIQKRQQMQLRCSDVKAEVMAFANV